MIQFVVASLLGTVIEITCNVGGVRFWQLVGGKFVIGIGLGCGALGVPLYLSEISPHEVSVCHYQPDGRSAVALSISMASTFVSQPHIHQWIVMTVEGSALSWQSQWPTP